MTDPEQVAVFSWGGMDDFTRSLVHTADGVEILRDDDHQKLARVVIAPERGSGTIEYLCEPALRVLVMDGDIGAGLSSIVVDNGWIRLNFSLRIAIDMAFADRVEVHEADPSWRLIRLPEGARSVEVVPAGAPFRWVTICCPPEELAALAGVGVDDLPFRGDRIDEEEEGLFYRPYRFTHALHAATTEMFERRPSDALRAAQLSAKARELLAHALDHLLTDQNVAEFVGLRLSQRDLDTIEAARDYLDANMAQGVTISALSRRMGINRNKLFYGFKSRFGMTVSEYVAQQRLKEAMRLLTESEETLTEIAAAVGFRHQCNFSTAFKKHFGVSPRAIRQRREPV